MDISIVAEKSAKPLSFLNESLFCKFILFAQIGNRDAGGDTPLFAKAGNYYSY